MSLAQYEAVCKAKFQEILDKQDANDKKVNGKLDDMHKRLFMDNGMPCHQTRIDRHDRLLKVGVWLVGLVCAASVAQLVRGVYDHVREDRASNVTTMMADPNSQTVRNSR